MAPIRMSEAELRELASTIQRQRKNLQDITRGGTSAVGAADAEWRSSAFDSFRGRWTQDRMVLDKLAAELHDWSRKLNQHADVARRVNRPFA